MTTALTGPPNPFVGPRAFRPGEQLYGREAETRHLAGLLVAERIVLLHAPSGAGKTSLIQAALIPRLSARQFYVRPVMRVGAEPPAPGANRYLLSALLALEEGLPEAEQLPLAELAGLSLAGYLARRPPPAEADGEVLVFDQLEEILTADPTDLPAKQAFFEAVGEALRDRGRWALFAIREDYLGALEPFVQPVPTRLHTTCRLDALGVAAAQEAMRMPALAQGVAFSQAAAERLAADLSRVAVQGQAGLVEARRGPTVEPVQLQVVCYRLWERLARTRGAGLRAIEAGDLSEVGDVDRALRDYYDERVARTAAATGVAERTIRIWFDRQLIAPQGLRGQVLRGAETSQGLPNVALPPLIDAYLVRAERRRGSTWVELAHDRLVAPVRASNAAWLAKNLSTLQRQADLWEQQGRPAGLLLHDEALAEAEAWAARHEEELTSAESAYLRLCREARAALDRERRQARRIRDLAIVATIISVVALLALVAAVSLYAQSEQRRRQAVARELAAAAVSNLAVDPELSVLLAREAVATTRAVGEPVVPEAYQALQQAAETSRLRQVFVAGERGLQSLAYSPDGALLATAGNDGVVRVWEATTGRELHSLPADPGGANGLAFSPDGALLAVGSGERAMVWDLATTAVTAELAGHTGEVLDVAFSPDGARLATASRDGTAGVWDLATGAPALTLGGDAGEVNAVAFHPHLDQVATASDDGSCTLWDATTGEPVSSFLAHGGGVRDLAFSPDGQILATVGGDVTVQLWYADSDEEAGLLLGHTSAIDAVAFSPDGKYLATAGEDATARVWGVGSRDLLVTLAGHGNWATGVAFSPDGAALATSSMDGRARRWSLDLLPPDDAAALAFSPDGALLATGGENGAWIWEVATGHEQRFLLIPDDLTSVGFSRDAGLLLTAGYAGIMTTWDLASGAERLFVVGHAGPIYRALFSPDGAWIASCGEDGAVSLWESATGERVRQYAEGLPPVYALAFSPGGERLAAGDQAGVVHVWDTATGEALLSLPTAPGDEVNGLAFSPDGRLLAAASEGGLALVWEAATGAERLRLTSASAFTDVAFSPDGQRVATAGADHTVRVWDVVTGKERLSIPQPDYVYTLAFSPDGQRIATAAADGLPRIYPLHLDDLLDLAEAHTTRDLAAEERARFGLE